MNELHPGVGEVDGVLAFHNTQRDQLKLDKLTRRKIAETWAWNEWWSTSNKCCDKYTYGLIHDNAVLCKNALLGHTLYGYWTVNPEVVGSLFGRRKIICPDDKHIMYHTAYESTKYLSLVIRIPELLKLYGKKI